MQAGLVLKLVQTYHHGDAAFRQAVEILAEEEIRNGNAGIAESLRNVMNRREVVLDDDFSAAFHPSPAMSVFDE